MSIDQQPLSSEWNRQLKLLVGEAVQFQRDGLDVMASSAWDDIVRHWTTDPTPDETATWRCFHCNELFVDAAAAKCHFGPSMESRAVCQTEAAEIRELEKQLSAYRNEDTDLHRQIARMESSHPVELRREEEKGYARGLRDAHHVEPQSP